MRRQETFLAHVRMTKLTGLNDLSIVEEKAKTLVWNIRPCSGTASLRSVNLISSVPFELMDVVALPPAVLSKVTKLHVKTTPAPILNLRKLFLDAESFWVQLNYQLIHLMDFLPIADWSLRRGGQGIAFFVTVVAFLFVDRMRSLDNVGADSMQLNTTLPFSSTSSSDFPNAHTDLNPICR